MVLGIQAHPGTAERSSFLSTLAEYLPFLKDLLATVKRYLHRSNAFDVLNTMVSAALPMKERIIDVTQFPSLEKVGVAVNGAFLARVTDVNGVRGILIKTHEKTSWDTKDKISIFFEDGKTFQASKSVGPFFFQSSGWHTYSTRIDETNIDEYYPGLRDQVFNANLMAELQSMQEAP